MKNSNDTIGESNPQPSGLCLNQMRYCVPCQRAQNGNFCLSFFHLAVPAQMVGSRPGIVETQVNPSPAHDICEQSGTDKRLSLLSSVLPSQYNSTGTPSSLTYHRRYIHSPPDVIK